MTKIIGGVDFGVGSGDYSYSQNIQNREVVSSTGAKGNVKMPTRSSLHDGNIIATVTYPTQKWQLFYELKYPQFSPMFISDYYYYDVDDPSHPKVEGPLNEHTESTYLKAAFSPQHSLSVGRQIYSSKDKIGVNKWYIRGGLQTASVTFTQGTMAYYAQNCNEKVIADDQLWGGTIGVSYIREDHGFLSAEVTHLEGKNLNGTQVNCNAGFRFNILGK